jgi:arylformamidase
MSIDDEYNPRLRVANAAEIFARWSKRSLEVRARLRHHANLRYGTASAEALDFFPAPVADAPLLVFIHGGYWRAFDKSDFTWIVPAYVATRYNVAVVNYGLAPATPLAEIVRQLERACAWLYRQSPGMGVDPRRIVWAGHSAGAHLTAMMLTRDWPRLEAGLPHRLLAGALCISGIYDLRPLVEAQFLKSDLRLDLELARELSPVFRSPSTETPCVLAVGALESSEFRRQTCELRDAWPSTAVRDAFEVPDTDHFSVCEAFATPGHLLFETTCALLQGDPGR